MVGVLVELAAGLPEVLEPEKGCIKFISPTRWGTCLGYGRLCLPRSGGPTWEGEFIKSVGEEYQIVKRGKEYHGCGKEYNVENRVRRSNIIFPMIFMLLKSITSWEEGRGSKFWGRKSRLKIIGVGRNIKL